MSKAGSTSRTSHPSSVNSNTAYKDLANIFRTLPGPGEFSVLAPPLILTLSYVKGDVHRHLHYRRPSQGVGSWLPTDWVHVSPRRVELVGLHRCFAGVSPSLLRSLPTVTLSLFTSVHITGFTARRYALRGLSYRISVRLSVRLSVCHTRWRRFDLSWFLHHNGSPMILVFGNITFIPKFEGGHSSYGVKWGWGRYKLAIFDL